MTFAATLLFGRTDPTTVLEAMLADLSARGAVDPARATHARERVKGGWLPSTALLDAGAPAGAVLHALASVAGIDAAPPAHQWNVNARAHLQVDEVLWQRLMAVPIGFVGDRALVAFADVGRVSSSAALGIPPHVACMALEPDIRAVLSTKPVQEKSTQVAFLAPPSAVASALPSQPGAFSPGTAPNLGGTMVGAAPQTPAGLVSPLAPPPSATAPPIPVEGSPATAFMGSIPMLAQKGTQVANGFERGSQGGGFEGTSPFSDQPRFFSPTPTPGAPLVAQQAAGAPVGAQHAPIAQNTQLPSMTTTPEKGISIGQRVGRFVLERKLGEGGMATVFVGTDAGGGPQAAIKVVHEHLLTSNVGEEVRRRFQREVNAMRQLDHKNIVACLDAGRVGDTEYITTELMTGGSLNDLLKRIGKVPPLLALSFFGDFLEGLAHAHDKGVVHRDLKPDNLLLDGTGTIKIADFGIARVAEGTQLTATGGIIGTPSYMSPEQALAQPIDQRTDLYSAGVILYELITGRNPFEGDSVMATLGSVLAGNVRPIGEVEPSVPFLVDYVLHKMMSLRPDDRFPTAHAVLKALEPALARAKEYRELWSAVASKQPGKLAEACNKEAAALVAIAKREQKALPESRMRTALAAFRARSLSPDSREAKNILASLESGGPLRFARSTSADMFQRESSVDALPIDRKRPAYKELAKAYLAEGNPAFAAQYLRRAVMVGAVVEEDLKALAALLPAEEIDDVRSLDARLGGAQPKSGAATMQDRAWRPPPPKGSAAPQQAQVQATIVKLSGGNNDAAPLQQQGAATAPGSNIPGFIKVAVIIASTAIPLGVAILAWRGCG